MLLNGTLFSPNSGGDLRSGAHQSQIIGGDADVDHTQITGGDTVKLLGEYIPPSPPGFGTPGSIQRNFAVVASRWQRYVQFDRPKI